MDNPGLKLLEKYNYLEDPENPYKLKVFSYNDDLQVRNDVCNYQRICSALSTMRFLDQIVFAQFWAAIYFESAHATVLSTRGQPFGHSTYTNEFWSYRLKCLDHNSYVNHNTKLCIGLPGRVFLNGSPEWTQDVSRKYNNILYPQLNDAKCSNIQGSLAMPVIDGDRCIGVLEFVVTNLKDNFSHEMSEVCKALEDVGLKSVIQNENINSDISTDYSSRVEPPNKGSSRKSKSCNVTCNDITKLFGMPKADAAKICGLLSDNTFTKVHRRYGIDVWPCVRKGVVKSSAHNALEHGRAYHTSSDETRQIEHINSLLMQDNDDINFEDDLVDKHMDDLISNDGKRLREQDDEGPNPVLLEVYHHKNKRSRI